MTVVSDIRARGTRSPGVLAAHPSSAMAALPWRWFEFRRAPLVLRGKPEVPLDRDPDAVFAIVIDGHTIPFKFLRRPAINGIKRPVLLMLHGMGLTIATFRGVAPWLLASHDLLLPDYAALSLDSAGLPDYTSFKASAAAVWRLADLLGIERLSMAGNSLGGGIAVLAALQQPERVERLIFSNPAVFPQTLPRMYRWAQVPFWGELMMGLATPERLIGGVEFIGYVDKTRFDPILRGIYLANMRPLRNRLRLMQLIRQLPANARDTASAGHLCRLGTLNQPMLLTWGAQDILLAPGTGERLAAAFRDVTYDSYPELAHIPHEEAPERIGPRWEEFLANTLVRKPVS